MRKFFNICNIYISLWCLYYLQGTFYEVGSYISQGTLIAALCISIYYFLKVNVVYSVPIYLKCLNVLLVFFTIYGLLNILNGEIIHGVSPFSYLKAILISLLTVYPFYSFTRQRLFSESSFRVWALLFVVVAILSYYRERNELFLAAFEIGSTKEDFVNNSAYTLLALFPLVALYKHKPYIQYLLLTILSIFIIMGMKRGAVLIGCICIIWFFFCSYNHSSYRKRLWSSFLFAILVIVIVSQVEMLLSSNDFFNERILQTMAGDSSGRDEIYANYSDYFLTRTSFISFLFGSGADATLRLFGHFAHNDWLEIAINNGLLGLFLYVIYFGALFVECRMSKGDQTIYLMLTLFSIICFAKTFFSMSYNDMSFILTAGVGYSVAQIQMKKISQKQHN